jgi:O-antigen ligase
VADSHVTRVKLFSRLLMALLAWGAIAFGAAAPWAYWPLAAGCAALGVWGLRLGRARGRYPPRILVTALALVALAIAVQLLPLPYAAFVRVSPAADRLLAEYNTAYSFAPPAWHALSISPVSTLTALGLFVALALFLLGLFVAADRLRLDSLATALGLFGVALTIFGVVQLMFEQENKPVVYFVWPTAPGSLPFGPFINKNHFAGWMLMALPVVFGCLCAMTQASWRAQGGRLSRWLHWLTRPEAGRVALLAFCVVAMGTGIVLTKSRSGIGGFAIVLIVLAGFIVRRATRHAGRVIAVVAMAGLLFGAIEWAGSTETLSHFARASQDLPARLQAWRDTSRIISDFHWFGSGLGTYWMTMLIYQTGARDQIFFQAHNDYLQLAAEGGALVAVPAAAAILAVGWRAWRRLGDREDLMTRWIRAGAVAGLAGIAAQSIFEFSLQLPGITALCVVLLALATHRAEERPAHARRV